MLIQPNRVAHKASATLLHRAHPPTRRLVFLLVGVLLVAAALRLALLATDAFTFNSDEAIVALMARHIREGRELPIFFYGQAYMGSLDAILVSLGFALFGESVLTIRLVQSVLYLGVVASTFWLGWRLTRSAWAAAVAALLVAVPPTLMTLYTTATLGGYNETLLLGNLLLILGYAVTHGHEASRWRWALMGALAGLGWWTNGLIAAYLLPVGLLILRRFSLAQLPRYALAFCLFMLFSAPWWQYNFTHNNAALAIFFPSLKTEQKLVAGYESVPLEQRVVGLLLFALPAVVGARFPWEAGFFGLPLSPLIPGIYVALLYHWLRRGAPRMNGRGRVLLLLTTGNLCLIFLISPFGADPTGRYFLPLIAPLAVLTAATFHQLRPMRPLLAIGAVILLLAFNLLGNGVAAVRQPPGLTTQFDPISHIPHKHDQELMDFLYAHNLTRGYANYWVAFRLAFLSGERIILRAALPYKADLSYNPADDRYAPYREAVSRADNVGYVTANHPVLDEIIRQRMAERGVSFAEQQIGPYRVFYDLSERVTPHELGLDSLAGGRAHAHALRNYSVGGWSDAG